MRAVRQGRLRVGNRDPKGKKSRKDILKQAKAIESEYNERCARELKEFKERKEATIQAEDPGGACAHTYARRRRNNLAFELKSA